MKMFILAAGLGSRLWPLTKDRPKSLIPLGDGSCMLERQLRTAEESKMINSVSVVTGYRADQIDEKITSLNHQTEAKSIFNPFYDVSNNLMSVWCALHEMRDQDFVITNGDNLYNETVLPKIFEQLEGKEGVFLTIDKKDSYDDDDMKVTLKDDGSVQYVHKKIDLKDTDVESVGLVFCKGAAARATLCETVDRIVRDPIFRDKFWLEIFNSMVEFGHRVETVEIDQDDWREMDFHPDIEIIKDAMDKKLF